MVFPLYGLAETSHFLHAKINQQLRVATYNISDGEIDWPITAPEKSLRAIQKLNPDILVLQESSLFWQLYFKKQLAKSYPYQIFKNWVPERGLAVLSRYPIKTTYYGLSYVSWYPSWIVDVFTPLGRIQILNVHLRPSIKTPTSMSFSLSAAVFTPRIRLKEIKFYNGLLAKNKPTIIIGDFNETGSSGLAVAFLRKLGYIDAEQRFDNHDYTWFWKVGCITLRHQYDHVFSTSNLIPTKVQILHEGDSDHFPVAVDFIKM